GAIEKMKKLIMILAAGLALVGVVAAIATAEESTNKWKPAGTQFKAWSADSTFEAVAQTVHCGVFQFEGTTPKGTGVGGTFTEAEAQTGVGVTPTASSCNHPVTFNAGWAVQLHSTNSKAQCGASQE